MLEAYLLDWLNVFFRWFHVIAGVAWIGASFYFIWLDLSLEEPPEWKKQKGISGDLWAIHGGGFYEVAKYKLEPEAMPKKLHWFKWEAYTTWLTGMALMIIIYYVNAQGYLIDSQKIAFSQHEAILASLAFIFVSYIIYEILLITPLSKIPMAFAVVIFLLLSVGCWGADQLFSDRAAYIHIGALLGTIMAANVFRGIMPAQRALVECVTAGSKPNERVSALAVEAKLRSTHNNYFTLPLIFIMISNHYPMTYGHEYGWLILIVISFIAALTRHYFNQKHMGKKQPAILWVAALAFLGLIFILRPIPEAKTENTTNSLASSQKSSKVPPQKEPDLPRQPDNSGKGDISTQQQAIMNIVQERCTVCHAKKPVYQGFNAAPAGIALEQHEDLVKYKNRVITSMQSKYMPLANLTKMTDEERDNVIEWLQNL